MPLLLIVRHGQASFGAADYDALSALGVRQAQRTAAALQAAGIPVARVISGSLRRQRDTASAIARAYGLTASVDAGWDEYDADPILVEHSPSAQRLEHPSDPGAAPSSPRAFQAVLETALEGWIAAGEDSPAPETWPAFSGRVTAALAAAGASGPGTTVVCSSGGSIAAVCVALAGREPRGFVAFNRVCVNCGISRIVVGRGGTNLLSFNEHQHLAPEDITYR